MNNSPVIEGAVSGEINQPLNHNMPPGKSAKHRSCSVCGGTIRADVTEGHCPACLLDRLVDLAPETGGVASAGLADYELEEVIGRGGMGIVWRARQRRLDRVVAIKFLAGGGWASDEARARLRAEALAVARLRHPGIVPVIDVGESGNGPWLSMEFVAGQTLDERLKVGPLPPRIAAELLCAVTEAIVHAHQHGVLHRDLKPGNILLDAGGSPHVTDFGLARLAGEDSSLTRTGQLLGSPAYLAPEILGHAEPSEAGDVYALGATLYHALTGQPPFGGPTVDGVLRQVAESQPVPPRRLVPAISADLETIVLTCLEKLPTRRYASAALLTEDLRCFLKGRPIAARPISVAEKACRWCRRRPAVATLLAVLVVGTAAAFWRIEAARQSEQVERARAEASLVQLQSKTRALQAAETNLTASNVKLTESLEQLQLERTEDLFDQDRISEGLLSLSRLLGASPPSRLAAARLAGLMMHQDVARLSDVPEFFFTKMIRVLATPDGSRAFASAENGRLWRLVSDGERMRRETIEGSFRPELMTMSGDGSMLALVRKNEGNSVALLRTATGEVLSKTFSHGGQINGMRFSREGGRLALFGQDGVAQVWECESGTAVGPPRAHGQPIRFAAFSPDGRRLTTASEDGHLTWWETGRAEAFAKRALARGPLTAFAASSDGRWMATGDGDGDVQLWDAPAAQPRGEKVSTNSRVRALEFSPDGSVLACGLSDARVRLIRVPGGEAITEDLRLSHGIRQFVFSSNGERVALCSDSSRVILLNSRTGRPELQSLNHAERAPSAAFLSRGEKVLVASVEGTVRNWDLRPSRAREIVLTEPGVNPVLHGGALAPGGRHAVTWGAGGVLRRWSLEPADSPGRFASTVLATNAGRIAFALFSPDGSRVLAGFADGTARVITAGTNGGFALQSLPMSGVPMSGAFSPDGQWVAVGAANGGVHLWRAKDGMPGPRPPQHKAEVRSVAFSPDGQWLVTASHDRTARFWKWTEPDARPVVARHDDAVTSAVIASDGSVATASHDRTVVIRDMVSGEVRTTFRQGTIEKLVFSPDGSRLAMIPNTAAIRFWNPRQDAQTSQIRGHAANVLSAGFSPDGRRFATGSRDGTARVWDVNSGLPLTPPLRHGAGVCSVAFLPDGLRLFTASHDGTARVWDVPEVPDAVPAWAAKLPRLLAGELSEEERGNPLTALHLWEQMQSELRAAPGNDPLARVARWFGEPGSRNELDGPTKATGVPMKFEPGSASRLRTK